MAIHLQDLDESNVDDLLDWVNGTPGQVYGVVDEDDGIIAYAGLESAQRIMHALNTPQRVCVLGITTKYGDDVYVHRDHDGAWRQIVDFVDSWWEQEMDGAARPASDSDAVSTYFEQRADWESYIIASDVVVFP